MNIPKAILFDYGGTLLRSNAFNPLQGTLELMKHAINPDGISAESVQAYTEEVLKDIGEYESQKLVQIESKSLTRLIYEVHGISFDKTYEELDCIFLDKAESVTVMPGIREFLDYLKEKGIRLAVLSNTGFCEESHRYQLRK